MVSNHLRTFCRWTLLSLLALASPASAQLRISEFLAQNDGLTRDRDGDSPDWIELHNSSSAAMSLAGWRLTDTGTNLAKWTFPAVTIPANGYLLVFASRKNRAVSGAELHTNFQLVPVHALPIAPSVGTRYRAVAPLVISGVTVPDDPATPNETLARWLE